MANENKGQSSGGIVVKSEAEKSKVRVAARQAKLAAQEKMRGGRPLTARETTAIRMLQMAVSSASACADSIREGSDFDGELVQSAAGLVAACASVGG